MLLQYRNINTEVEMSSILFTPGSIYLVRDTNHIFIDPIDGTSRIMVGSDPIIILNTEAELYAITDPVPYRLYLVIESSNIYVYYNGGWHKGSSGYTPIKGVDYWTEEDKNEMKAYIDNAILEGEW